MKIAKALIRQAAIRLIMPQCGPATNDPIAVLATHCHRRRMKVAGTLASLRSVSVLVFVALSLTACTSERARKNETAREAEQACGLAYGSRGVDRRDTDDRSIAMIGSQNEYWVPCVTRMLAKQGYTPLLGPPRDGRPDPNALE